ncbi:hypothetical protein CPT_Mendera_233 [Stenotrophomonas phage Mendera]|uniref:Uncharacterized protein n=1 Tax=Stenotrophomonas phage Mendera TaxID=2650877 RepID=A0A5P8PJB2_9CAUD|nr:hypothetical protein HWC60_gp182 [Stenotrophomonas phage Mendera]QFR56759.1 hypothetical protein CPT_Mendera_233 [Stenotrophomonas phage Mendera]
MTIMKYEWDSPSFPASAAGCKAAYEDVHLALTTKSCWTWERVTGDLADFDSLNYNVSSSVTFGFRVYKFNDDTAAAGGATLYMRLSFYTINDGRMYGSSGGASASMFPAFVARVGKAVDSSGTISNPIVDAAPWTTSTFGGTVVMSQLPGTRCYIYTNTSKGAFHFNYASASRTEQLDPNGAGAFTYAQVPLFCMQFERSYNLATGETTANGVMYVGSSQANGSFTNGSIKGATLQYLNFALGTWTDHDHTLGTFKGLLQVGSSAGVMSYQPLYMPDSSFGIIPCRTIYTLRGHFRPQMARQQVLLNGVAVDVYNHAMNKNRCIGETNTSTTSCDMTQAVTTATVEV